MLKVVKRIKKLVPHPVRSYIKAGLFRLGNRGFVPYVDSIDGDGFAFKFYVGDRVGEQWFKGGWDWAEIGFIRDHLIRPGDVVLECGAHHGEMTLFLSHWVGPTGRVITFEPVPRNVEIIRKNIALNGLDNVTVVNKAVGAAPGTLVITDESNAQVSGGGPGLTVDVVTLDDYAHLQPTFLKIDVEGFEAALLQGAQQVLRTRPRLALEVHTHALPRYQSSVEEVFRLFGAEHYELWVQTSGGTTVSPYTQASFSHTTHVFALPKGH